MPDFATISAILSSVKTATEIAKFIRDGDISIERAELKLKIADLIIALADVKSELVELQETFSEKERKIKDLEAAFEAKDTLIRFNDAYYKKDDAGKAIGSPFCLRCWENEHLQRQLVTAAKDYRTRVCTSCGHQYSDNHTYDIQQSTQ